jgi:hypothetical protein
MMAVNLRNIFFLTSLNMRIHCYCFIGKVFIVHESLKINTHNKSDIKPTKDIPYNFELKHLIKLAS